MRNWLDAHSDYAVDVLGNLPVPATPVADPELAEALGRLAVAAATDMREPMAAAAAARDGGLLP